MVLSDRSSSEGESSSECALCCREDGLRFNCGNSALCAAGIITFAPSPDSCGLLYHDRCDDQLLNVLDAFRCRGCQLFDPNAPADQLAKLDAKGGLSWLLRRAIDSGHRSLAVDVTIVLRACDLKPFLTPLGDCLFDIAKSTPPSEPFPPSGSKHNFRLKRVTKPIRQRAEPDGPFKTISVELVPNSGGSLIPSQLADADDDFDDKMTCVQAVPGTVAHVAVSFLNQFDSALPIAQVLKQAPDDILSKRSSADRDSPVVPSCEVAVSSGLVLVDKPRPHWAGELIVRALAS